MSTERKAKLSILCGVIFLVRLQGKFVIDHSWEWKGNQLEQRTPSESSTSAGRITWYEPLTSVRTLKTRLAVACEDFVVVQWEGRYFRGCVSCLLPKSSMGSRDQGALLLKKQLGGLLSDLLALSARENVFRHTLTIWILKFNMTLFESCLLAELNKSPAEGFSAGLIDDDDLFKWEVLIVGPSDTF